MARKRVPIDAPIEILDIIKSDVMRRTELQQRLHNLRRSAREDAGLTPRAWIFMLILVCAICYWVFLAEMVYFAADLVSSSLMVGAVFPLCLLLLFNAMLSSRRQRSLVAMAFAATVSVVVANAGTSLPMPVAIILAFLLAWYFLKAWKRCDKGRAWEPLSRRELLLLYIAITVSTWFSSMGGIEFLASSMTSPFYFANASNGWGDLAPLIPRWISVRSPAALNPFFNGQASWLRPAFLHAWAVPILAWSLFVLCFFGFALAVNSLLRKQWIEHERLTFPIAQFPLQLTQETQQPPLWRSPLFWFGAILAFSVEAVNGIHVIIPTVPTIPILPTDLGGFLNQTPWIGAGGLKVAFYPWILGLVYLVPLDVSFSSWFFYLVARLEGVAAVALGVRAPGASDTGAPPYQMDQGFGAFLGLALITLWAARSHLAERARSALSHENNETTRGDRWSFLGLIGCGIGLLVWFRLVSNNWYIMAGWFAVYALMLIAVSRMRAEAGPGWIVAPRWPQDFYWFSVGSNALSHSDQMAITAHTWLAQDVRHTPMATQMEGFKIADSARISPGWLALFMVAAMIAALASSWWAALSVTYRYGYGTAKMAPWRLQQGRDIWGWLHDWLNGAPMRADKGVVTAWVAGFLIIVFLSRMRQYFLWWPFHPVGYAIGNTFSMVWLWFPTLIGWGVKALVLRYGGSVGFRRGIPFAIGLILGDFFISGLFAVISTIVHAPMYKTFPVP